MLFSTSFVQSQSPRQAGNGCVKLHFQCTSLLILESEIRWRAFEASGITIVTHPLLNIVTHPLLPERQSASRAGGSPWPSEPPELHPEQVPTSFYRWENEPDGG